MISFAKLNTHQDSVILAARGSHMHGPIHMNFGSGPRMGTRCSGVLLSGRWAPDHPVFYIVISVVKFIHVAVKINPRINIQTPPPLMQFSQFTGNPKFLSHLYIRIYVQNTYVLVCPF